MLQIDIDICCKCECSYVYVNFNCTRYRYDRDVVKIRSPLLSSSSIRICIHMHMDAYICIWYVCIWRHDYMPLAPFRNRNPAPITCVEYHSGLLYAGSCDGHVRIYSVQRRSAGSLLHCAIAAEISAHARCVTGMSVAVHPAEDAANARESVRVSYACRCESRARKYS